MRGKEDGREEKRKSAREGEGTRERRGRENRKGEWEREGREGGEERGGVGKEVRYVGRVDEWRQRLFQNLSMNLSHFLT